MGVALNTLVNGSPETLWLAADFLGGAASGASSAAFHAHHAGTVADASWDGPARNAFAMTTNKFHPDLTDLSEIATHYQRTARDLGDLGDALDTVNKRMNDAMDKATAGGLHVEGPFIIAPDPPAAPQILPTGPCGTAKATRAMQQNQAVQQQHSAAVADYNAKAAVFNECKAIVTDARKIEKNAHDAVEQTTGTPGEPFQPILGLTTAASTAVGVLNGVENTRLTHLQSAAQLARRSEDFTNFARGLYGKLDPLFQKSLTWAASLTDEGNAYRKKVEQYGILRHRLTSGAVDFLTAYPGKPTEGGMPKISPGTNTVLKALPYAGAGVTAFNEVMGAVKGEQSWGKAVVDTGATTAGGAAGGVAMGAFYGFMTGAPTGPGALVTGLVGGFIGGIGGQRVADALVPE